MAVVKYVKVVIIRVLPKLFCNYIEKCEDMPNLLLKVFVY